MTNTFTSVLSLQLLGSHQTARIYLQPFLLWNSKPVSCCPCLQQHHHDSKLHPSSFLLASELSSWNSNLLTVFTAYQQLSPSQYCWGKVQLPPQGWQGSSSSIQSTSAFWALLCAGQSSKDWGNQVFCFHGAYTPVGKMKHKQVNVNKPGICIVQPYTN